MVVEIVFTREILSSVRRHLLSGPNGREEAAYLECGVTRSSSGYRLLVRRMHTVPDEAASKSGVHVTVDPAFIAGVLKEARQNNSAIVLCHSHPFSDQHVAFSGIDDGGERSLVPRIQQRVPGLPTAAIVFGRRAWAARAHLPGASVPEPAIVRVIGEAGGITAPASGSDATRVRQDRILSRQGNQRLAQLRVAVVGVGGTGSHVVQQLAMAGVRRFLLIDPDDVEPSNLNRLVRSEERVVGRPKVDVAKDVAMLHGATETETIRGDCLTPDIAHRLKDYDLMVGCTDNHRSRTLLNRIASQWFLPLVDTGIEFTIAPDGSITGGISRVDLVLPGTPCLECRGILGVDRNGNYGVSHHEPSIAYLNALTAAHAVATILDWFVHTPFASKPLALQYRIRDRVLKPVETRNLTGCTLCAEVFARGDSIHVPTAPGDPIHETNPGRKNLDGVPPAAAPAEP